MLLLKSTALKGVTVLFPTVHWEFVGGVELE